MALRPLTLHEYTSAHSHTTLWQQNNNNINNNTRAEQDNTLEAIVLPSLFCGLSFDTNY